MNYQKALKKFTERDPFFTCRHSEKFETIAYLRGNLEQAKSKSFEALRKTARAFLRENADLFGKESLKKLEISLEAKDPNGGADIVYQQYHGKALVYAGGIRFHFNKKGILDTVSSRLNPTLASVPLEPKITADEAAKRALRKLRPAQPVEVVRTLYYYYKGKTYLVWEVHLRGLEPSERGIFPFWIVYVDAITGRVIHYYDAVMTMAMGKGYYLNPGMSVAINTTTLTTGENILIDDTRPAGPQIVTRDARENKISEDLDNNWDASGPLRMDNQGAEVDVHVFAGEVADYLSVHFGRNSFDGQGSDMTSEVHMLDPDQENAYWLGTRSFFGDGTALVSGKLDYVCSKDVVAHEFGHGVTNTATNGLQYTNNETGALHESFSDFMAALITQNWLIGEKCWLPARLFNPVSPALRNMIDPTNGGKWIQANPIGSIKNGHQPAHYSQYAPGDPHINSGIINQFFYLLCAGGTNPVSGRQVDGIGENAVKAIFYRALTVNLLDNLTANFLDFRQAMLDACIDLYPADLIKLTEVKKAFLAVGIGPDLFIRDDWDDIGLEPNTTKSFASPDIMSFHTPLPTINMQDLSLNSSLPLEAGQTNYIYARMQNIGFSAAEPTVKIYLMPATSFGPFSSWTYMGTMSIASPLWFHVGLIGYMDLPIAKQDLPPPGHYCMIAVVNDSYDPAPDPSHVVTISDYIYFIRNTNNVAYLNMNIVNYEPDVFKWHEFTIGHIGRSLISYNVSFDLDRFVPGATFFVRGPRRILDGTNVRGLRLIERDKGDNIYEALSGDELIKHQNFTRALKDLKDPLIYGFEDLRTNKAFKIKIGYKMPSKEVFKKLGQSRLKEGFQFAMRQFYEDQLLGSVGLKFRQDGLKRFREKRQK